MGCGQSKSNVEEKPVEVPIVPPVVAPKAVIPASSPAPEVPAPPVSAPVVSAAPTEVNFKPIHSAIRWNKPIAEIEALLTSEDAVNCPDKSNGNCPIHIASQNGHNDIIKLLIEKKVNLNAKNGKGNTGIHMAVGYDYFAAANMMIAAGGDPDMLNDLGIPANLGLEGDKAMGIAALVCAETGADVDEAFALCEAQLARVNKINFVSAGLKAKKNLGALWTPDHQVKFKDITTRLS